MSTPTPDLAEAEQWLRDCADDETRTEGDWRIASRGPATVLMAEYDRRGTALEQAEAFGIGEWRVTQWAYDQADRVMHEAKDALAAARSTPGAPTPDCCDFCPSNVHAEGNDEDTHTHGEACCQYIPPGFHLREDPEYGDMLVALPASPGADTPAGEPAVGSVVLAANGEAFQRAEDGYWRSSTGRSHGWRYMQQAFSPLALLAARSPQSTPAPPATEEPQPAEGAS